MHAMHLKLSVLITPYEIRVIFGGPMMDSESFCCNLARLMESLGFLLRFAVYESSFALERDSSEATRAIAIDYQRRQFSSHHHIQLS